MTAGKRDALSKSPPCYILLLIRFTVKHILYLDIFPSESIMDDDIYSTDIINRALKKK